MKKIKVLAGIFLISLSLLCLTGILFESMETEVQSNIRSFWGVQYGEDPFIIKTALIGSVDGFLGKATKGIGFTTKFLGFEKTSNVMYNIGNSLKYTSRGIENKWSVQNIVYVFFKTIGVILLILLLSRIFIEGIKLAKKKKQWTKSESFDEYFEDVAVFSGSEKVLHCPNLKQGKIVAVFGVSKLNLNNCSLYPEGAIIDINCVFGGTSLIIPSDWNVKFEVFNIFGGFADQRHSHQVDNTKTLIIKGVCIFGGGELKSF